MTEELKKENFKFDAVNEAKVVEAILKLLEDSSGDVQGMAVKSLGPLVRKISDANVTKIINQLTTHMANMKKSELREISNIGLKGVIQDIDDVLGEKVCEMLIPKLLGGLKDGSPPEVVQESLDILCDLLVRFGAQITKDLPQLQKAILPQLESARQVSKKRYLRLFFVFCSLLIMGVRATQCLTQIARNASEPLFNELVQTLITQLQGAKAAQKRTYIQALGSLARTVYHRLGKFIPSISPLLKNALEGCSEDGDEDIKENVLQTYEAFVLRCPKDVSLSELDGIIDLSLRYITFDPNFAGDDDSSGSESSEEGSFASDEEDDVEEDDESWK